MSHENAPVPWCSIMSTLGTAAALSAAASTGLLTALLGPFRPASEYARELGLDARATQRVLSALAALGLIQQRGTSFGIEAVAGPELAAMPRSVQALIGHFNHVLPLLRTGEPLPWMDASLVQREASYSEVVADMGKGFAATASLLAAQLNLQPQRILDVGCGSGVWSLEIGARYDGAQVTGLDFPAVLRAFVERAHQTGLGDRIASLPGDMFSIEVPAEAFDLVVIANVLRLEAAERASALIARMAAAVKPGGQMLIIDALASGTPEKDLLRASYSLHLAIRTKTGEPHAPAQITEWLLRAGLTNITPIDCGLQPGAIGALLAQKN